MKHIGEQNDFTVLDFWNGNPSAILGQPHKHVSLFHMNCTMSHPKMFLIIIFYVSYHFMCFEISKWEASNFFFHKVVSLKSITF